MATSPAVDVSYSTSDPPVPIPKEFPLQVAGHRNTLLQLSPTVLQKTTTPAELLFYESCAPTLRCHIPNFHGGSLEPQTASSSKSSNSATVRIENVLAEMRRPCVADVKIGVRLHDDLASDEKRLRMQKQSRDSTSGSVGLKICGMRVVVSADNDDDDGRDTALKEWGKEFGRSLTKDTIDDGFRDFFSVWVANLDKGKSDSAARTRLVPAGIIKEVRRQLCDIEATVRDCECRLYSSSLLIGYDFDAVLGERLQKDATDITESCDNGKKRKRVGDEGEDENVKKKKDTEDKVDVSTKVQELDGYARQGIPAKTKSTRRGKRKRDAEDEEFLNKQKRDAESVDVTSHRKAEAREHSTTNEPADELSNHRHRPSSVPDSIPDSAYYSASLSDSASLRPIPSRQDTLCGDTDEDIAWSQFVTVRLIDFAHSHFEDGIGPDEGALLGISNLVRILDRLLLS